MIQFLIDWLKKYLNGTLICFRMDQDHADTKSELIQAHDSVEALKRFKVMKKTSVEKKF